MKDNLSAYSSDDYDKRISTVLPYYSEFHFQILDLIDSLDLDKAKWLDTGCGTGSLVKKAAEKYDNADFTLCDPSVEMLGKSKNKLEIYKNISYVNISSQQLNFENEFDIITAVQAHHYLNREQRNEATRRCFNALKDGGVYVTFENIALSNEISDKIGTDRWKRYLKSHGKSKIEVEAHVNRRGTEVFPITIEEHLNLIKDCGFKSVDILWASYMQAGFFAIK